MAPGALPMTSRTPFPPVAAADGRILALDGVRGFATILVVVSHYFAEISNGVSVFAFGWYAVNIFFVLSGFLIGRLIIDKQDRANFLSVFFIRRLCRTVPSYIVCVLVVFFVMRAFDGAEWTQRYSDFPLWAYLTFTQNFFMAATGTVGAYWLSPTWTLALEEQFYLLAPLAFLFLPRQRLLGVLVACALSAVVIRAAIFTTDVVHPFYGLVLLPSRADVLLIGVIAAILYRDETIDWSRYDQHLRVLPVVMLSALVAIGLFDRPDQTMFRIFGPFLVSVGAASFLLSVVRGAPEAKRFESRFFRFFGDNSYCIYLTHLMVLGLFHGLILGTKPALGAWQQWAVTIAALPLCVLVGWALTRLVEEPITAYGRSWKWSDARRKTAGSALQS